MLDFQGLLRSALIGRFCRGGELLGLSDAREGARFFYDRVARVGREHAVDRYLKLVAALGIDTAGPLTWNLPQGSRPAGFTLEEPFVLLHPFSRGEGKSLSPEETLAFAKALPCAVVLAGRASLTLPEAAISELPNRYRGKVRENYDMPDGSRVLIATDRLSAFDRMICAVPFKGQVLTQTALVYIQAYETITGRRFVLPEDLTPVLDRVRRNLLGG